MMLLEEFTKVIKPLEKRFKALNEDQLEVYFNRLKTFKKETLQDVVESFIDDADRFPTPGKLKMSCRELIHKQNKSVTGDKSIRPSCAKCRHGFVDFKFMITTKRNELREAYDARPCAFCNTEPNVDPHYIQSNNVVFMAAKKVLGSHLWAPDINNPMIREDVDPLRTNEDLEMYWLEERSGVTTRYSGPEVDSLIKAMREKAKRGFESGGKPCQE
jgi:hypothetical protein